MLLEICFPFLSFFFSHIYELLRICPSAVSCSSAFPSSSYHHYNATLKGQRRFDARLRCSYSNIHQQTICRKESVVSSTQIRGGMGRAVHLSRFNSR